MLEDIVECIVKCIGTNHKVLVFGVGGNAANAMHMAAELSGKFEQYDECYPCFCLVDNPCEITAITNDFGWDHYFERQVLAKAFENDVVIAFSISGNGRYLENGFTACREKNAHAIWICGKRNEAIDDLCNHVLDFDSLDTPKVQEKQCEMIHMICGAVKARLKMFDWNT